MPDSLQMQSQELRKDNYNNCDSRCGGCGHIIVDRYYLLAVDRQWHCHCLKCDHCGQQLESQLTCFSKAGLIYCKNDYRMYSLMNRVRNVIRDEDVDKFDELIYKREEQAMLKAKTSQESLKFQSFMSTEDSSESSFPCKDGSTSDANDDENDANSDNPTATSRYLLPDRDEQHSDDRVLQVVNNSNFSRNSRLSRSDGLMSHRSASATAAYRRMMLRRHSSSATEAPVVETTNANNYGTPDERHWSIAAHEVPHDYQHVGTNYSTNSYEQKSRARSLSGGEMRFPASATGDTRGSRNHLHVPCDSGYDRSLILNSHSRVRGHRSLPSPTFSNAKPMPARHQHRSWSFRLPSHRAISEPNGQWRVSVKKSKPILGIAIEGGVNVHSQTQPRIISIHSSGAAIECGDLHVGHIILEVDGRSTATLSHDQVAHMIAHAYYNTPYKDFIEFLVREKSRNEFDLRRSSFMLLNNSFE